MVKFIIVHIIVLYVFISTDWVVVHIRSWFGHVRSQYKAGLDDPICGVFFNWILR